MAVGPTHESLSGAMLSQGYAGSPGAPKRFRDWFRVRPEGDSGRIGIMNIMLASVLERTREIGVRRAVGARQRDVVRQFLIETTIISLTGGVAGILLGVAMSQLIGVLAGWSTIVTTSSIVLAFGVSVAIGIVFGLYPAVRASRLDPVKALHYE